MRETDNGDHVSRRRYIELATLAGATGLAGCAGGGGGGGGDGGGETTTGGGGGDGGGGQDSMTVWAWNDQALEPVRATQADTFESDSGIPLEWQYFPWGDYLTKLQSALAAGNAPESFALATMWIPKLADSGAIGKLDKSEFPEMIDAAKRNSSHDGKLYSVPWYADCRALCINVDMFEEAGLEVPDDNLEVPSWDQFASWVSELTTDDRKGYVMAPDAGFEAMFLSNGGRYLEPLDGGGYRAAMADDEVVEAAHYFLEDLDIQNNVLRSDEDLEQFLAGNAAMTYAGSWELDQLDNADVNYMYLPQPSGPSGDTSHTWSAGVYYSVAQDPSDRAREWMNFIMSEEQQLKVIDKVGGFPGRASVYETDEFQEIISGDPTMELIAQEMQKAVPLPRIPNGIDALGIFRPAIERVWQGQAEPKEAFEQADKKVKKELDEVKEA